MHEYEEYEGYDDKLQEMIWWIDVKECNDGIMGRMEKERNFISRNSRSMRKRKTGAVSNR